MSKEKRVGGGGGGYNPTCAFPLQKWGGSGGTCMLHPPTPLSDARDLKLQYRDDMGFWNKHAGNLTHFAYLITRGPE